MVRSPSGSTEGLATRSPRASKRNLAGAALVVGGFLAAPVALVGAPSSAAPRLIPAVTDCSVYAGSFGPNVVKVQFSYNPNPQRWLVPSNAITSSICIDASGGQGGPSPQPPLINEGGYGGTLNVVPSVSSGQSLQ